MVLSYIIKKIKVFSEKSKLIAENKSIKILDISPVLKYNSSNDFKDTLILIMPNRIDKNFKIIASFICRIFFAG